MRSVRKSEPRPTPPNWLSRKPEKPRNALKERPEVKLSKRTKSCQPLPKTLIAGRKKKLHLKHERPRAPPKKWCTRRKTEMRKIPALK